MRVVYKRRFEKEFRKLPSKIKEQFFLRLQVLFVDKFNPILNNHSVDPTFPDCRSINVTGDYRAIFAEQDELVVFVRIATHSELYS